MPNIKSAEKRVLVSEARRIKNAATKSKLKTAIKKFDEAVTNGSNDQAKDLLVNAISNVDKAAHKNIIHKNAASRKKSQLQKALNKAAQA